QIERAQDRIAAVAVTRPLAMARLNVRWSKAVPVIAIPLAFRSAAACAVEATNGLAVQSLTWISPHHGSIFYWGKNRNRAAADFKILGELKSKSDGASLQAWAKSTPITGSCR